MKTFAALCLALLLPLGASGPSFAASVSHQGRGVVRAIKEGGRVLVLEHEAIPGFMEAMTMPFEVADARLVQGIRVGDRVAFTLTQDGDFWPVTALSKLQPKAIHHHRSKRRRAAAQGASKPPVTASARPAGLTPLPAAGTGAAQGAK